MNKINYQKELDKIIENNKENKPSLMLHSCCAPCSSAVLESVFRYFEITVFYYNPNISPREEFDHRVAEQIRLIAQMGLGDDIQVIRGEYEVDAFMRMSAGHEGDPEGG